MKSRNERQETVARASHTEESTTASVSPLPKISIENECQLLLPAKDCYGHIGTFHEWPLTGDELGNR